MSQQQSFLSRRYFDGLYIPIGLLLAGTLILRPAYLHYAVAVAAVLGTFKFSRMQTRRVLGSGDFIELPLAEKTVVSHNVAIYRLRFPGPTDILGLPIGQHLSIAAEVVQEDGTRKEIVRSYTPISGDETPGYVDLLIKSYPTGNISRHMATLGIEMPVRVRGPKGAFVYTPNMVRAFAMIAGGTGITPMLQIIKAVIRGRAEGDKTAIDLIFANVTDKDILLKEDLDGLAAEDPAFRVHYVLDQPPEGWTGGVGYVTEDMMRANLPAAAPDVKLLLCGPPPMVRACKKTAEVLGFDKARAVSKLEDQVFAF